MTLPRAPNQGRDLRRRIYADEPNAFAGQLDRHGSNRCEVRGVERDEGPVGGA
jgi:hypothetical protein